MQDTQKFIKGLYDAGYNHIEIALLLHKDRKLMKIQSTEKECIYDVERTLLELHRKKVNV